MVTEGTITGYLINILNKSELLLLENVFYT